MSEDKTERSPNHPEVETIDPDRFQTIMMFGVQHPAKLTLSDIDRPWKDGILKAFKVLDLGYCLDLQYPTRATIDSVKLPEPYEIRLVERRVVELDYRLERFLEFAPLGDVMERFLRFKIKPEKGREAKISNRVLTIHL